MLPIGQAGAQEGKSAEAAAGSSTILSAAAKAAAGAYSSVAQIPYVGWILAPAAAAVAFTAVAGYQTVASAEGGWGKVPYDGYPTELHRDEMVLPANIAQTVRDIAAQGGMRGPSLASAAASAPSGTTINNGGNTTSHSAAFHQTNTFHTGADIDDIQSALRSNARDLHSTAKSWYGNTGTATLPGRQVRK